MKFQELNISDEIKKAVKDLGYEEQTWYQKDKNIKRYILLKKLGETENG